MCIVDATFAKTHWPGESPHGKRVTFGRLSNPVLAVTLAACYLPARRGGTRRLERRRIRGPASSSCCAA